MGREPEPAILWLEKPSLLLHAIAVALVVGTIAVPLCLFRFCVSLCEKAGNQHHGSPREPLVVSAFRTSLRA